MEIGGWTYGRMVVIFGPNYSVGAIRKRGKIQLSDEPRPHFNPTFMISTAIYVLLVLLVKMIFGLNVEVYVCLIGLLIYNHYTKGYHGAEHKVVLSFKELQKIDLSDIFNRSPIAKNCGTNTLWMVLVTFMSIILMEWWSSKIAYLVVFFCLAVSVVLSLRSTLIQRLFSIREPTKSELEVAIFALRALIQKEHELASAPK